MKQRLTIIVLGVTLGLAAKYAVQAYATIFPTKASPAVLAPAAVVPVAK